MNWSTVNFNLSGNVMMIKKVKCISKENCYEGYLQVSRYELTIPSFDPQKKSVHIKQREIVRSSDSVLVLIYIPKVDCFLLCQEFRLGVFLNEDQAESFILECVSGTIDKNNSPEDTAIKEVFEETGLSINAPRLLAMVYKSPGLMTEKCYLYYAELKDLPNTGIHGLEDEEILTKIYPRETVYQFMDEMKIIDSATLLALNWFRANNSRLRK